MLTPATLCDDHGHKIKQEATNVCTWIRTKTCNPNPHDNGWRINRERPESSVGPAVEGAP